MVWTIFPKAEDELPQDFSTYAEAVKYGEDLDCDYELVWSDGDFII